MHRVPYSLEKAAFHEKLASRRLQMKFSGGGRGARASEWQNIVKGHRRTYNRDRFV